MVTIKTTKPMATKTQSQSQSKSRPKPKYQSGGFLPTTNDAMAIVSILATYMIRIAATAPGFDAPWYLFVVTDAILPLLAGMWLWVAAMYIVIQRVRRQD